MKLLSTAVVVSAVAVTSATSSHKLFPFHHQAKSLSASAFPQHQLSRSVDAFAKSAMHKQDDGFSCLFFPNEEQDGTSGLECIIQMTNVIIEDIITSGATGCEDTEIAVLGAFVACHNAYCSSECGDEGLETFIQEVMPLTFPNSTCDFPTCENLVLPELPVITHAPSFPEYEYGYEYGYEYDGGSDITELCGDKTEEFINCAFSSEYEYDLGDNTCENLQKYVELIAVCAIDSCDVTCEEFTEFLQEDIDGAASDISETCVVKDFCPEETVAPSVAVTAAPTPNPTVAVTSSPTPRGGSSDGGNSGEDNASGELSTGALAGIVVIIAAVSGAAVAVAVFVFSKGACAAGAAAEGGAVAAEEKGVVSAANIATGAQVAKLDV